MQLRFAMKGTLEAKIQQCARIRKDAETNGVVVSVWLTEEGEIAVQGEEDAISTLFEPLPD